MSNISLRNTGARLCDAKKYRRDKDLAYKEGFDEFVSIAQDVEICGKRYLAHPNINLYYDMCSGCNCSCDFCIAKVGFNRGFAPRPDSARLLECAIDSVKHLNPSVQVVGGEPTAFGKELTDVICAINTINPSKPVLGTNGYGLKENLLNKVVKSRFEHINISRHHYNDSANAKIMHGGVDSNVIANACSELFGRVRVQCNFIGGGIDTYEEVSQFIAYAYHRLNVRTVAFAQLTPLPRDSFYNQDIIDYIESQQVDIDSILDVVEVDDRFEFEKYRGGLACYYEVWRFTGYDEPMTILFKYSDNKWLEKADDDPVLLPDLVLHVDGTLSGSWCKDRKIINTF